MNTLDPEAVIVGGGLGLSEGPYWEHFIAATRRHIWSDVHRDLPILRAATGRKCRVDRRGGKGRPTLSQQQLNLNEIMNTSPSLLNRREFTKTALLRAPLWLPAPPARLPQTTGEAHSHRRHRLRQRVAFVSAGADEVARSSKS